MRSVCLQCEPQCSKNTLHIMMMWSLQAYQKCKQLETSFVTIHPYNHPPSTIIGLVALVKSVSSTHMDAYWIIARWSWSLWRQSQLRAKVHPLRPVISGDCVMRNGISPPVEDVYTCIPHTHLYMRWWVYQANGITYTQKVQRPNFVPLY